MHFYWNSFCITLIASFISRTSSENCSVQGVTILSCRSGNSPTDFTNCCWSSETTLCCPLSPLADMDAMNESFVMVISIFVILLCLTLSVFFVVCCFWSPCPLYSVCRMNYTYGDIVAYSKEEEALNLPPETCGKTHYTPLHVKMKPVEDV